MSTQDKHPAQGTDTATPVFPVVFFKDGHNDNTNIKDWRPQPIPAMEGDKTGPKASSAPEPAVSSETSMTSTPEIEDPEEPEMKEPEETEPASPASTPATKASGPSRAPGSGKAPSPAPKTPGK